jgi:hypothetical protein
MDGKCVGVLKQVVMECSNYSPSIRVRVNIRTPPPLRVYVLIIPVCSAHVGN